MGFTVIIIMIFVFVCLHELQNKTNMGFEHELQNKTNMGFEWRLFIK